MAITVGINRHYAAPPPLMVGMVVVSLGAVALAEKFEFVGSSWISSWIGLILVLFAIGSVLEILKWLFLAIERQGYKTAIEDLRLLCIGEANFRGGYPKDHRNLLAAAIVTLDGTISEP